MKKILILAICSLSVFMLLGLMPVHGEEEIYDNVVRLHVIANSDTEEDQELKLKVRDAVLGYSTELIDGCNDINDAVAVISGNLEGISEAARECVRANGYDYPVEAVLCKENYPTKNYESFCFPSGKYVSLQIKLGEAEGRNWWCVLFPPLCVSAASAATPEDAMIDIGLTGEQYRIITDSESGTYSVRFKILETIEETFRKQ
ncbi:MAG: stage II sporulation protein R [Eubacteriales bacterium]